MHRFLPFSLCPSLKLNTTLLPAVNIQPSGLGIRKPGFYSWLSAMGLLGSLDVFSLLFFSLLTCSGGLELHNWLNEHQVLEQLHCIRAPILAMIIQFSSLPEQWPAPDHLDKGTRNPAVNRCWTACSSPGVRFQGGDQLKLVSNSHIASKRLNFSRIKTSAINVQSLIKSR